MVSKIQWKPFWLATQLRLQDDWAGWQNGVNDDVCAQALFGWKSYMGKVQFCSTTKGLPQVGNVSISSVHCAGLALLKCRDLKIGKRQNGQTFKQLFILSRNCLWILLCCGLIGVNYNFKSEVNMTSFSSVLSDQTGSRKIKCQTN